LLLAAVLVLVSCSDVKRQPGSVYMPDMAYSRAYETYASTDVLKKAGVNYSARPVTHTVARGAMEPYPFGNDSIGYERSKEVKNPLNANDVDMVEAERIYLINCGICHGAKLNGNGPLYNGGEGPYTAAPKNLVGDSTIINMAEGTMFHSITYGKNLMGGYGSQLSTKQRWEIVAYIKKKQQEAAGPTATEAVAAPTTSNMTSPAGK